MRISDWSSDVCSSNLHAGEWAVKIGRVDTFLVAPRWVFGGGETEDGASGWWEASLEGHAEAVDGAYEALRDRFVGQDASRIEYIWQVAYRSGFYRGGPVLMSALSGLDQALWDLKGKVLNLPAWEMMGGKVRDRIRAYARSEEHTPELQTLMRHSYAVFCLKKKTNHTHHQAMYTQQK